MRPYSFSRLLNFGTTTPNASFALGPGINIGARLNRVRKYHRE